MSSILINIGITIVIFISTIMIYNAIMNQPIFSIPWSNENTILKNNISQNISDLQKQINKISDSDINNIKDNIIPSIQKTLEKTIEDVKNINLISNKDLQKQIDELNILLLSTKKSIEDSNTVNKSELKIFSDNLKSSIDKLSEKTSSEQENIKTNLQKQIDDLLSFTKKSIEDSNKTNKTEIQNQIKTLSENLQSSIDKTFLGQSELQKQIKSIDDSNIRNKSDLKTFSDKLQNSIDKLSEKSLLEQENIKTTLQKQIDDLLSFTKKSIEDSNTSNKTEIQNQLKTLSEKLQSSIDMLSEKTISNHTEIQKQIDFTKKSIDDSNTELQNQLKTFSYNLQSSIDKLSEKTFSEQTELQKQIESIDNLNKLNNEEIKLKIIPSVKESIVLLENIVKNIDDKIIQNKNDIISDLSKLKNDIQKQIESQTIDTKKSIADIEKTIDNLKNENETKIFVINTYTKDGTQIQWTVKGDDNGNLCISDTKNMACIERETGFLFNGKI